MSKFITATDIHQLSKIAGIVKSYGLNFSGVYPTASCHSYIVSTWSDNNIYQTVNVITREIEPTTQADFRDFVEGQR